MELAEAQRILASQVHTGGAVYGGRLEEAIRVIIRDEIAQCVYSSSIAHPAIRQTLEERGPRF